MKNDTSSSENFDDTSNYLGRVKWFNNKAGYGFVTIIGEDSDRVGEDVFVHHTGVKVDSEQYKYLVQGEYASFNLKESDSDSHPFQAHNMTGVMGGKLMCETRNEQRQQRDENEGSDGHGEQREQREQRHGEQRDGGRRPQRQRRQVRPRGSGPRDDGLVWALVQPEGGERRPQRARHNGVSAHPTSRN